MGIRIHKVMGYGLDDLSPDGDARLAGTPSGIMEAAAGADRAAFRRWLRGQAKAALEAGDEDRAFDVEETVSMLGLARRWRPADSFHWDGESGLPGVLVVVPPGFADWSRYDDGLDYAEFAARRGFDGGAVPEVLPIPGGIYPFTGALCDARDGRPVRHLPWPTVERLSRDDANVEAIRKLTGMGSPQEVRDHLRPPVPAPVRHLCEWLGVFAEPGAVHRLKPLLYTWWS